MCTIPNVCALNFKFHLPAAPKTRLIADCSMSHSRLQRQLTSRCSEIKFTNAAASFNCAIDQSLTGNLFIDSKLKLKDFAGTCGISTAVDDQPDSRISNSYQVISCLHTRHKTVRKQLVDFFRYFFTPQVDGNQRKLSAVDRSRNAIISPVRSYN